MMTRILLVLAILGIVSCKQQKNDNRTLSFPKKEIKPVKIPDKENIWVFILAGQSNMAGRGLVEPQDTIPSDRVLTINHNGEIIVAKEPLHFYEKTLTGLDCGLSFGKTIIKEAPDSISVLLLPCAIGGSSISQWLGDSLYRNVRLLTNFKEKAAIGKKFGNIKGILWLQGESDANQTDYPYYKDRLARLLKKFREIAGDENLPVLIGSLGSYSDDENWMKINEQIKLYSSTDTNSFVIDTHDLKDKGDKIHYNSEGQRLIGNRFANAFLKKYTGIPKDTSFTPYQAWIQIKREFPQAIIVKPQLPEGVIAEKEIIYASLPDTPYGKRNLHLDLFRPDKTGRYPALILVFGGGWRSGNKSMQVPMAQKIAAKGFVTATVEYRLSPEAIYPAAVYDIKAAIRFLRANADKYNIDPDKIAITGSSAGGQLAALIGSTAGLLKFEGNEGNPGISTAIQAIIDMDGILDFTDPNESAKDDDPSRKSAGAWWFGATFKEAPGLWIEASPIQYIGKNTPPMLFINSALPRFHAGRDSAITILNKYNIYSEVHTIPNTPHPFWLFHPWFGPTVDYMVAFLDKILK